jgi:hypothetical protein
MPFSEMLDARSRSRWYTPADCDDDEDCDDDDDDDDELGGFTAACRDAVDASSMESEEYKDMTSDVSSGSPARLWFHVSVSPCMITKFSNIFGESSS